MKNELDILINKLSELQRNYDQRAAEKFCAIHIIDYIQQEGYKHPYELVEVQGKKTKEYKRVYSFQNSKITVTAFDKAVAAIREAGFKFDFLSIFCDILRQYYKKHGIKVTGYSKGVPKDKEKSELKFEVKVSKLPSRKLLSKLDEALNKDNLDEIKRLAKTTDINVYYLCANLELFVTSTFNAEKCRAACQGEGIFLTNTNSAHIFFDGGPFKEIKHIDRYGIPLCPPDKILKIDSPDDVVDQIVMTSLSRVKDFARNTLARYVNKDIEPLFLKALNEFNESLPYKLPEFEKVLQAMFATAYPGMQPQSDHIKISYFLSLSQNEIKNEIKVKFSKESFEKIADYFLNFRIFFNQRLEIQKRIIDFLLDNGCSIADTLGVCDPLYLTISGACSGGTHILTPYLLKKGANLNTEKIHAALLSLLLYNGSDHPCSLPIVIKILKNLLEHGFNPDLRTGSGEKSFSERLSDEKGYSLFFLGKDKGVNECINYIDSYLTTSKETRLLICMGLFSPSHQGIALQKTFSANKSLFERRLVPLIFELAGIGVPKNSIPIPAPSFT